MSADQRTIWNQWSEGNAVSDIDFQTKLRSGRGNFYALSQNYSLVTRSWYPLDFPPPPAAFEHGIIRLNYMAFEDVDSLFVQLNTTNLRPVLCAIWATAQRPSTTALTLSGMKFVTVKSFTAGTAGGTKSESFMPEYLATFGFPTLVAGNRATLFCLLLDSCQLELSAAADLEIFP